MTTFAETTIDSNCKVYLKDSIRKALDNAEIGDVLEWHITDQTVVVRKKQ